MEKGVESIHSKIENLFQKRDSGADVDLHYQFGQLINFVGRDNTKNVLLRLLLFSFWEFYAR